MERKYCMICIKQSNNQIIISCENNLAASRLAMFLQLIQDFKYIGGTMIKAPDSDTSLMCLKKIKEILQEE